MIISQTEDYFNHSPRDYVIRLAMTSELIPDQFLEQLIENHFLLSKFTVQLVILKTFPCFREFNQRMPDENLLFQNYIT